MSEKMLVTQALDERDLLVKKIGDKIQKIQLVDTKKRNEEKTVAAHVTTEEYEKAASAAYQQIMDLIDRYQRIDAAIVASNAATTIKTSYGDYTVVGAIALRNRLRETGIYDAKANFEGLLINQMERQYQAAVQAVEFKNRGLESQAETMRLSILGKDSKVKDVIDFSDHFRSICFDDLSVRQLGLKDKLSEEAWNLLYMGDSGEYTPCMWIW